MENNDKDCVADGSEEDGNHDDYTDGVKRIYKMIDDNDNDGEDDLKILRSSRKKECADESAVPPDESRQPWTG